MIFEFTTNKYADEAAIVQKHMNEIAGKNLLNAIRKELVDIGFSPTTIDQEDWGWYIELEAEMPCMIGAVVFQDQGAADGNDEPLECLVQVWRTEPRKVFGLIIYKKEVHAPLDDPFVATLNKIIHSLDKVKDVKTSVS